MTGSHTTTITLHSARAHNCLAKSPVHKGSRPYTFIANDIDLDPFPIIRTRLESLLLVSLVVEKDQHCC